MDRKYVCPICGHKEDEFSSLNGHTMGKHGERISERNPNDFLERRLVARRRNIKERFDFLS